MIRSSLRSIFGDAATGWREMKAVFVGNSAPIFSAMQKRPVGVLKLPSSLPRPYFEVEIGKLRNVVRPHFTLNR